MKKNCHCKTSTPSPPIIFPMAGEEKFVFLKYKKQSEKSKKRVRGDDYLAFCFFFFNGIHTKFEICVAFIRWNCRRGWWLKTSRWRRCLTVACNQRWVWWVMIWRWRWGINSRRWWHRFHYSSTLTVDWFTRLPLRYLSLFFFFLFYLLSLFLNFWVYFIQLIF